MLVMLTDAFMHIPGANIFVGTLGENPNAEPSQAEVRRVKAKILQLHRASQHCHPRSLARMLKDAGKPPWMIRLALDLKCDVCDAVKPGVAGQVPTASVYELPRKWQH